MNPKSWKFDKVQCPKCGETIAVSETLSAQVAAKVREDMADEIRIKQQALVQKEATLNQREDSINEAVQQKLASAKAEIEALAKQQAKADLLIELEDLKRKAAETETKLDQAQKAELQLRTKQRQLEEKDRTRDLEVARTLDAERGKIQQAAERNADEKHRLKDAEIQKQLQDALKVNDDLKRKLQQGSQQTQGEVLELDLEQSLRAAFPIDQISPVPKGITGADILQIVVSNAGNPCGTIIWETKRTKAWSDSWISKLKEDQRRAKADIAVLVSEVLPKDCNNFQEIKGVWVSNPQCAANLAAALRLTMTQVAHAKRALVGKNEKMEVLYHYLSGSEFRQRIEAIVEAFVQMQGDLHDEKRAAEKRWAKREKQIERVISNTSGMYGDLQGLIGSSLHDIPLLTDGVAND